MALTKNLQLVLDLKDNATKKMRSFSDVIKDNAATLKSVGRGMTVVGGAISGIAVAAGAAAAQLEATEAKYSTVFKGMTDISNNFIQEFQKLTPATTAEARSMASGIQDLLVPMGFMREEATNMTGRMMHLIGALTNFNSATHSAEDVTIAMQAALTGSYETLKRLGIQVSKEIVQQKVLAMGLANSKEEITKQMEAQALLELAYEQSGDALAAYNEESLDTKTKIGLLKAEIVDIAAKIGNAFLPIVSDLIDKIKPLINQVTSWIDKNPELAAKITLVVAAIGGLLVILGPLLIALPSLVSGFSIFIGILGAILSPIGLIITALIALGGAMLLSEEQLDTLKTFIFDTWTKIKEFLFILWDKIKEYAPIVWEQVKNVIIIAWEKLKAYAPVIWESIKKIIATIWDSIKEYAPIVWGKIKELVILALEQLKDNMPAIMEVIQKIIVTVWNELKEDVPIIVKELVIASIAILTEFNSIINSLLDVLKQWIIGKWTEIKEGAKQVIIDMLNSIKDLFLSMVGSAKNWGANLMQGIVDGIKSKITAIKNAAHEAVKAASRFIGFKSPAKEGEGQYIMDWGANMIKGFIAGMKQETSNLKSSIDTIFSSSISGFKNDISMATGAGLGVSGASNVSITISGNSFLGTPSDIVDQIQELLQKRLQGSLKI